MRKLLDWWRGWSNDDLQSLAEKFRSDEAKRPDGYIKITERERRCLRHFNAVDGAHIRITITEAGIPTSK